MPDQSLSDSPSCPGSHSLLSRRSLLLGLAGLGVSSGLSGCSGQRPTDFTVRLLSGSLPPQLVGEFQKTMQSSLGPINLHVAPETQLQALFLLLQTWQRQGKPATQSGSQWPAWVPFIGDRGKSIPDLVTLGNYWLPQSIQQGLLQPLDPTPWKSWHSLIADAKWPTLVTRNAQGEPDPKGAVWAAPYRWGSTVIAYRRDIFQDKGLQPPQDWSDLWRPELRRQISLLDQPREVIGLTLKKLGYAYNTADLKTVSPLESALRALHQQAKLYSSDAYLQPLLLGDTWVAVGWSTDILPIMQRNPTIAAVFPASGTALWADLWVRPKLATTTDLPVLNEWINFGWQPQIAERWSLLSRATSPAVMSIPPEQLGAELRGDRLLLPSPATFRRSEFLQPITHATAQQYQDLWSRLRAG
jgi:putative spermidine/putrescine transport system substrate-binding protein